MAWSVYKQPDSEFNYYSIWDSVEEAFVYYDCSPKDIRDIYKEEFGRSGAKSCEDNLKMADGEKHRFFYRGSYEELLAREIERHGKRP